MDKKRNFGEISSKNIKIGDIISWAKWDREEMCWKKHLGVVLELQNTEMSHRMVHTALIMPLKEPKIPTEMLTFSLNLVSSGDKKGL